MVDVYKVGSVCQPFLVLPLKIPHAGRQSCGYAIPFYSYQGERNTLSQSFNNKEQKDNKVEAEAEDPSTCKADSGIKEYWEQKNTKSLDGLPGLSSAPSVGFRSNGYNINAWTKTSPVSERPMDKPIQALRYMDAKFLAGVATGGLLANVCYTILQHAQLQLSMMRP